MLLIVLEIRCLFPVSCSHSLISFHGYSIQWKELQLHRHLSPIIWILFTECLIEGTALWRRSGWPATRLSMLSLSTATGQMQRLDWHYSRTNRNKTSKMKLRFFPQDAASGADGETIAGRRIRVSPARPRTVGPRDRFIPDKYSRDRGKSPSWNRNRTPTISSLQMTTIVAGIMTEEITTEGTQTGEIIERIATTRGQGTS